MTDRRNILISPSLMCADQLRLRAEVDELVELGVDLLHLDIMDGHYVPNLTFGIDQCRALGARYSLPLDIHLMVDQPERWAPAFAEIGDRPIVTIHPETTWHPARVLHDIKERNARPGIAVAPSYNLTSFRALLKLVDVVLVLTVNPGYAGQKLIPEALQAIREARALREELGLDFDIEVDGNVSWDNIPIMVDAGADILVAGSSSLFDDSLSRAESADRLHNLIGHSKHN
jgi:ribulose-phosphate 3-epimerase